MSSSPAPGTTPTPPLTPAPGSGPARRTAPRWLTFATIGLGALAVALSAVAIAARQGSNASAGLLRPSGIPANVSTSLANQMVLSALPHPDAPGFTLTDQAGRTVSLASLRGKVVVLEFMDPHCTDICPIVSQEFVDAYHDLGPAASKVVFMAVNVNAFHTSVSDVAAFSREHALTTIPSWHFLTGQVPALQAVWRDYAISVSAPNPNADIVHTSAVYFITADGKEAYLASPSVDRTSKGAAFLPAGQLAAWGKGIALVARDLAG